MAKLVQINDIHISDNPPVNRTRHYQDEIYDKLDFAFGLESDAVILTGDVFHHHHPSKTSHYLVGRLWELIEHHNKPVFTIIGNHDVYAGRVDNINKQPLGMLARHPLVTMLDDGKDYNIEGVKVRAVNWDYKFYNADGAGLIKYELDENKPDLLVTHAPILDSTNPYFQTITLNELGGLAKVISWGHIHAQHPITKLNGTQFSNPGSLSRRSLGGSALEESESQKTPHVAVLTFGKEESIIEYVELPAKPMDEVYLPSSLLNAELGKRTPVNSSKLEAIIDVLNNDDLESFTPDQLRSIVSTVGVDSEIIQIIEELLNIYG